MTTSMRMPLLPGWLGVVGAVVMVAVAVVHARHAMSGGARWWHAGHVAMALGMAGMFLLPQGRHPLPYWAAVAVFGGLATASAVAVAARRRRPAWPQAGLTVGLAAMAYMALPMADHAALPTYLLVTYLCVEALVWSVTPPRGAAPGVRLAPAVMAVGMAWMLVAMQIPPTTAPAPPMRMGQSPILRIWASL